jgi:hypothetical protein
MAFRVASGVACALLMGAVVWAQQSSGPAPSPRSAVAATPDAAHDTLIDVYCATCHSRTAKSADVTLEGFRIGSPLMSAELLEKMIRKLRAGQMPPAGAERPDAPALASLVDALEQRADAIGARANDPGWRPFQRLNRAEYAQVIKDLLALDIDPSTILPPDTVSGGFDNIADIQTVSPTLITTYLRGAATVSRAAVGLPGTDTPSRRKIFLCTPATAEDGCAARILQRLTRVAFRGTETGEDLADARRFFEQGRTRGGFDEGIRLALQSILVSPKFFLRLETVSPTGEINDLALASRLSFFLWGTVPDDALIAAAREGALHTPAQLATEARRMLADRRAESLSTRFAGQWLRLQDLGKNVVDPTLFPAFSPALAADMRRETQLVVADLIRRDGDVMELVTGNRSFINARLAAHYGIPNIRGDEFRAVAMPEERRGLLGQGSILTLTSLSTRSSPVLRGKWVLDVLLGTPPPPPPPNVPALDDSVQPSKNGAPLSTRQRVEAHRANPSCSSCHRVIDPPGMTLENFDATGRWRTVDNGVAIDAAAELYDGRRMDGPAGLRAALVGHQDMVLRQFTQSLMTYALGRRLSYRDMPAVRAIVRTAADRGNRFSAFVTGVVSSDAFRLSRPPKDE